MSTREYLVSTLGVSCEYLYRDADDALDHALPEPENAFLLRSEVGLRPKTKNNKKTAKATKQQINVLWAVLPTVLPTVPSPTYRPTKRCTVRCAA